MRVSSVLGCVESQERRLRDPDGRHRHTSRSALIRLHPHSLRSGRVQVEPAVKKSQWTAEVRGEGSTDESYIATRFEGMIPWLYSTSIHLQSILVSGCVVEARKITLKTLRICSIAIALVGCAVLDVTAKPAPVPASGAHSRDSKVTIPATTQLNVKLDQVVSAKTAESGGGFTVTFSEPVRVDGSVVIPTGATGAGLVNRNSQNGTEIELNSVFVNGRSYRVTTSPILFDKKNSLRAGSKITFDLVLSLNVFE